MATDFTRIRAQIVQHYAHQIPEWKRFIFNDSVIEIYRQDIAEAKLPQHHQKYYGDKVQYANKVFRAFPICPHVHTLTAETPYSYDQSHKIYNPHNCANSYYRFYIDLNNEFALRLIKVNYRDAIPWLSQFTFKFYSEYLFGLELCDQNAIKNPAKGIVEVDRKYRFVCDYETGILKQYSEIDRLAIEFGPFGDPASSVELVGQGANAAQIIGKFVVVESLLHCSFDIVANMELVARNAFDVPLDQRRAIPRAHDNIRSAEFYVDGSTTKLFAMDGSAIVFKRWAADGSTVLIETSVAEYDRYVAILHGNIE